MIPHHGDRQGQTGTPVFDVETNATTYGSDTEITVSITGSSYVGFLLQARSIACGCDTPVGTWIEAPTATKTIDCDENDDSMTHTDSVTDKEPNVYKWVAPAESVGDIEFVATVLESFDTFWIKLKSGVITGSGESVCCTCEECDVKGDAGKFLSINAAALLLSITAFFYYWMKY
ncbi:putative defense protein 3 [Glandiceps talaboti]